MPVDLWHEYNSDAMLMTDVISTDDITSCSMPVCLLVRGWYTRCRLPVRGARPYAVMNAAADTSEIFGRTSRRMGRRRRPPRLGIGWPPAGFESTRRRRYVLLFTQHLKARNLQPLTQQGDRGVNYCATVSGGRDAPGLFYKSSQVPSCHNPQKTSPGWFGPCSTW